VVLATAAVEKKQMDDVSAAAVASSACVAKDNTVPPQSETETAAESEPAAADPLDPQLLAEAAQLRRKRLEVLDRCPFQSRTSTLLSFECCSFSL
jgi:hypothetical protein